MNRVKQIKKQTDNRFLNLYEFEAEHRDGKRCVMINARTG